MIGYRKHFPRDTVQYRTTYFNGVSYIEIMEVGSRTTLAVMARRRTERDLAMDSPELAVREIKIYSQVGWVMRP